MGPPAGPGTDTRLPGDRRRSTSACYDWPHFETELGVSDSPIHSVCGVGRASFVQAARAAACIFLLGSASWRGRGNCSAGAGSDELCDVADRPALLDCVHHSGPPDNRQQTEHLHSGGRFLALGQGRAHSNRGLFDRRPAAAALADANSIANPAPDDSTTHHATAHPPAKPDLNPGAERASKPDADDRMCGGNRFGRLSAAQPNAL